MTAREETRYDIANLPISQKTRDGLTPENINYIGAIGRMLLIQDKVYDEQFEKLFKVVTEQNKLILEIKEDINSIKRRLDILESRLDNKAIKIALLDKCVEDIDKRQKNIWIAAGISALAISVGIAVVYLFHKFLW